MSLLTTFAIVVIVNSMKAELIYRERRVLAEGRLLEQVVWKLPQPVPPCTHAYKYRLVYVVDGVRVVGYDNERGKGDHIHIGIRQYPYRFENAGKLLDDFFANRSEVE